MPGFSEAYPNLDLMQDEPIESIEGSPVTRTISTGLQLPDLFSIGLSRDASKSFLALGGVPSNVETGKYTTTPLLSVSFLCPSLCSCPHIQCCITDNSSKRDNSGEPECSGYTIQPDSMIWTCRSCPYPDQTEWTIRSPPVMIDSGTIENYLPSVAAYSINSAFEPPAVYDPVAKAYYTACIATPPMFGISIGGQWVWTDPSSMILPEYRNELGECQTGIKAMFDERCLLGVTFMQGLVIVHDIGKREMRIANRPYPWVQEEEGSATMMRLDSWTRIYWACVMTCSLLYALA